MVAWVGLLGCTTTTRLTPVAGATTEQSVEELASQPGAHARLTASTPPLQPIVDATGPYAVVGHQPGWLTLSDHVSAARVPLTRVQSVSTYHHARGALDGALVAGGVGFLLGVGAGFYLGSQSSCGAADGPCPQPHPVAAGLVSGAIVGAITAALGAAVGAIVGHETRYEIAAP